MEAKFRRTTKKRYVPKHLPIPPLNNDILLDIRRKTAIPNPKHNNVPPSTIIHNLHVLHEQKPKSLQLQYLKKTTP